MKAVYVAVLSCLLMLSAAFGQGSLTPSAAPGATMKTLQQVEPRIPIPGGTEPYTISARGAYYLETNMYRTLTIAADNVSVDLMGFIIDPSSATDAIDIPGNQENLHIHNGILTGGNAGIDARYLRGSNSRFEDLIVSDFSYCGLYIGSDCLVRNCLLLTNGSYGIQSSSAGRLEVRNCRVIGTAGDGIEADNESIIVGNTVEGSGGFGIQLDGTGSYVADNIVRDNADNYAFEQDNQINLLLCEVPEILEWPCKVTFAGTLSGADTGIIVRASNVHIDMNGHALVGPGTSGSHGIYQSSAYNALTIRNGAVINWRGSGRRGISLDGTANLIEEVQVISNDYGISISDDSTVRRCTIRENDSYGISGDHGNIITDCMVLDNGSGGISLYDNNTVKACTVLRNGFNGISVDDGNLVMDCLSSANGSSGYTVDLRNAIKNCMAVNNSGYGIALNLENAVESCTAASNGNHGIYSEYRAKILSCHATHNGSDGIHAGNNSHITDCTSSFNDHTGIWVAEEGLISECAASFELSGTGIVAGASSAVKNSHAAECDVGIAASNRCEVLDCSANNNDGDGIRVDSESAVVRCTANQNSEDGIEATTGVNIMHCTCNDNGYIGGDGAGIHVTGTSCVIDGNTVIANDRGIDIDDINNLVIRNRSVSTVDYDIVADNHVAAIANPPTSGAISGGSGGSGVGTTDPWDNFAY